jgi:hypothetical protein
MKYLPTIDLWADGIQRSIYDGDLKIQRGQWMICGPTNSKKCRYVGSNAGHINVVHWQGNSKTTNDLFIRRATVERADIARHKAKRLLGRFWEEA